MPMHHGSAEDSPDLHVLQREKVGHCFNGFDFMLCMFNVLNFNVHLMITACG
jgi:hypothetical protein